MIYVLALLRGTCWNMTSGMSVFCISTCDSDFMIKLEFPLDSCGARLYSPPPPPSSFPRTTVRVPIPSRPTGGYFRFRSARPLPVGSPWPWTRRPPNRCHAPLPCPPSPFLCHARGTFTPIPNLAFSGDLADRSNPAPRARAQP